MKRLVITLKEPGTSDSVRIPAAVECASPQYDHRASGHGRALEVLHGLRFDLPFWNSLFLLCLYLSLSVYFSMSFFFSCSRKDYKWKIKTLSLISRNKVIRVLFGTLGLFGTFELTVLNISFGKSLLKEWRQSCSPECAEMKCCH